MEGRAQSVPLENTGRDVRDSWSHPLSSRGLASFHMSSHIGLLLWEIGTEQSPPHPPAKNMVTHNILICGIKFFLCYYKMGCEDHQFVDGHQGVLVPG